MSQETFSKEPIEGLSMDGPEETRSFLQTGHPADVATFLQGLPAEDARDGLLSLPIHRRSEVFDYFEPDSQVAIARRLTRRQLAEIVTEMDSDDRADLFNRLSTEQQEALLPGLAQAEREDIRKLASHEEGTAGAVMTSDYATLSPDLMAADALAKLRREAPDKETIYRTYVLDENRRLIGSVRLRDLILADPHTRVSDLMERETFAVGVNEDQEEVARKVARYDVIALPVVDTEGYLVGIITHDDVLDVLQEEATEDFHKAATVGVLGQSVRDATISLLYRKRVGWLTLLVFGNLFSGAGIAYYEETIVSYVVLMFFLPLLIASGGNAGAQASTLMVRALATGEIVLKDWSWMLGREFLVAIGLGLTMALAIAPIGLLRGDADIAMVVALTMVLVVLAGSIIGMLLPFLLSRFRLDPAAASAPLVTSIADVTGVMIYFGIATLVLLR